MLRLSASVLLAFMALFNFLLLAEPSIPTWFSGLCAWLSLALLFTFTSWRNFIQFFLLAGLGLVLLLWGLGRGASLSLHQLLIQNNSLLVMLYSVGFLRLVAIPAAEAGELPRGRMAFVKTLLGIHVLGAVINLSILVLVAGRYHALGLLGRDTVSLMGQAFSAAAFWSPFFAAMGVALTYTPGAQLLEVIAYGLILTLVSLTLMTVLAGGWHLQKVRDFPGYPMHLNSLIIPASLAALVIGLHLLLPEINVLALVSISSITLVFLVLLLRNRNTAWSQFKRHLLEAAPRMGRELALFLGAGVLTLGLQILLSTVGEFQLFKHFGGIEASLVLGGAILVSMLGIHPIISIAVLGPLVLPLRPNLELLATLFLSMWSLGVVANPISGTNVMLHGQFGVSGRDAFRWNLKYVVLMWLLSSLVFISLSATLV
ncbi:hypothetical protein [uncultured Thiothrix sp.]|uniref:hypothetical protein n=1 Tax=uncultured Thiothrix sp. TaxID=223185 RepID=UPI00262FF937|nr:hypothetical protein [uncultured Thiothrix sp.]HMT93955.1 hypothetical protein [Thiolinea sp.]